MFGVVSYNLLSILHAQAFSRSCSTPRGDHGLLPFDAILTQICMVHGFHSDDVTLPTPTQGVFDHAYL